MPLTTGQVVHQRYRIVRLLGQGGFGAVYRVWDLSLQRPWALKENLETSPEAQRQFEREAVVLANLSHPNLPRVVDYFSVPGQGQYLVMDFIDGDDLGSIIQEQGSIPVEQAVAWISQVVDALTYLHSQHPPLIHRDIKPANVRIAENGRAFLVDFGLVKVLDTHLKTTIGARAVTPGYSPPEQYGQARTDARSDLYSLAATLYIMLTGQEPVESIQRSVGADLPTVNQLNPKITLAASQVIERGMNINPAHRYSGAEEFLAVFKQALAAPAAFGRPSTPTFMAPTPAMQHARQGLGQEAMPAISMQSRPGSSAPRPSPAVPTEFVPRSFSPPAVAKPAMASPKPALISWQLGWIFIILAIGAVMLLVVAGGIWQLTVSRSNATSTAETALAIERENEKDTATAAMRTRVAERTALHATLVQQTAAMATANYQRTSVAKTATAEAELTASMATVEYQATLYAGETLQALTQQVWTPAPILLFGPRDGDLVHNTENDLVEEYSANVDLSDFIVEVSVSVPYSTGRGVWDFGLLFRDLGGNNQFRLVFFSDKTWKFQNNSQPSGGEHTFNLIADGYISGLSTREGAYNLIKLICRQTQGELYVNDVLIDMLDLSDRMNSGDVSIGVGLYNGNEITGEVTTFVDFRIWSLP